MIHAALARFAASFPTDLPSRPDDHLLQIGLDLFGPLAESRPELHAEWWPHFERLAGDFLRWEEERRSSLTRVHHDAFGS